MEDSNSILPPENSSQQLTIRSVDVSSARFFNNVLPGAALVGFNTTSATIDGAVPSFYVTHQAAQTSSLNPPLRNSKLSFTLPTVLMVPLASTSMSACFQKSVPELQSTKIDGDPLNWLTWISVFQATIHHFPMS